MIIQERLKELVSYCPETGVMSLLKPRKGARRQIGEALGSLKNGYLETQLDLKRYYIHRLAFVYMTGSLPNGIADHRDRDRLNNKWANLRDIQNKDNALNSELPRSHGTLGVRGVYRRGDRFCAKIVCRGKQYHLGIFTTLEAASIAYQTAKPSIHAIQEF